MSEIVFETDRLIVRRWAQEDAPAFLDMYSRPEVWGILGERARITTITEAAERIAFVVKRDEQWDWRMGSWPTVEKATGRYIGTTILRPLTDDTRVEVGWHLHPSRWGHGFATEAGAGAVAYGFERLSLEAVRASPAGVLLLNPARCRVSWPPDTARPTFVFGGCPIPQTQLGVGTDGTRYTVDVRQSRTHSCPKGPSARSGAPRIAKHIPAHRPCTVLTTSTSFQEE